MPTDTSFEPVHFLIHSMEFVAVFVEALGNPQLEVVG